MHVQITYLEFMAIVVAIRILLRAADSGYAWVRAKLVKRGVSAQALLAFDRLRQLMAEEVGYLEQTVVRPAKDPTKPGLWSDELAREVRTRAVAGVRTAGAAALDVLAHEGVDPKHVDSQLERMLEASVASLRAGATATARTSAPPAAAPAEQN